jgi:hypothetical protein
VNANKIKRPPCTIPIVSPNRNERIPLIAKNPPIKVSKVGARV